MPHIEPLNLDATRDALVVKIATVITLFRVDSRWNALMETDVGPAVTVFLNDKNYKGSKEARTSKLS